MSLFAGLVAELQAASDLDDDAFLLAWRPTRFIVDGRGRSPGFAERGATDSRRLRDLAALLPRLVADPSDHDRWPASELLACLAWRDPFAPKHGHAFPVTEPEVQVAAVIKALDGLRPWVARAGGGAELRRLLRPRGGAGAWLPAAAPCWR